MAEVKQKEKKEGNLEYLCTVDEFETILEEEIRKLRKEEGQNDWQESCSLCECGNLRKPKETCWKPIGNRKNPRS